MIRSLDMYDTDFDSEYNGERFRLIRLPKKSRGSFEVAKLKFFELQRLLVPFFALSNRRKPSPSCSETEKNRHVLDRRF